MMNQANEKNQTKMDTIVTLAFANFAPMTLLAMYLFASFCA